MIPSLVSIFLPVISTTSPFLPNNFSVIALPSALDPEMTLGSFEALIKFKILKDLLLI